MAMLVVRLVVASLALLLSFALWITYWIVDYRDTEGANLSVLWVFAKCSTVFLGSESGALCLCVRGLRLGEVTDSKLRPYAFVWLGVVVCSIASVAAMCALVGMLPREVIQLSNLGGLATIGFALVKEDPEDARGSNGVE